MKSLRIAYVITDLRTGGVPLHLLRLAVVMRDRGARPLVISLAGGGEVADQLVAEGIPVYSCNAAGRADVLVIPRLAFRLWRISPDLVHSFLFHANVASRVAVPLACMSSRRLITEIQTVETERRWHLTVGGMTHRLGYCVVANSTAVFEHLHRQAHMTRSRLRCIPGGVDTDRVSKASPIDRSSLGVRSEARVIMWVGRLDPVKGLDELIDAFAEVRKKADVQLILVGEGGYEPQVRQCIRRHQLESDVLMLGRRDDVPSLLHAADVFAFPSRTEGMPNALLEAMAGGLPVVTTDVPGCRELVLHEQTGLIVPSRDTAALASAITRLLDDDDLAKRLGIEAAANVAAHHSFSECVDRYASLYEESLSS